MQLQLSDDGAKASISGDFTFADHATFKQMISALFETSRSPLVIDLSQLTFIDSAGLGMLLLVRDEAGKGARQLLLRSPQGQVKRMFELTRFETLFAIEA